MPDRGMYELDDRISGRKDKLFFWLVLTPLALLFFAWVHWIISNATDHQADRDAFIGKCIEFHSVDRCLELDRWGRRDLYDRKDFK